MQESPSPPPSVIQTSDLRVKDFETLPSPASLTGEILASSEALRTVQEARSEIRSAIAGTDRRLLVIAGPCSIHDPEAAREYAQRLLELRKRVADQLLIVMRVYFEKPRTAVGWKGLINDPNLDGSCNINEGLRSARRLLEEFNAMGIPCATEFLDPIVPQYIADLVAWAAIGARTTESQTHREMASGLSMPVGFKNATDGALDIALNGLTAARQAHSFLGINPEGHPSVVRTVGNPDVHLVLRGGATPNFAKPHIAFAKASLEDHPGARLLLVDCSHGNSGKDPHRQPAVFESLLEQHQAGEETLLGLMLESHLVAGSQKMGPNMVYGQSITDACLGWDDTEALLEGAAIRMRG